MSYNHPTELYTGTGTISPKPNFEKYSSFIDIRQTFGNELIAQTSSQQIYYKTILV
jgi:hypothetical protein